ncbi:uncharacterized protein LOC141657285 isoform X2 [Silene latifolia]|uniref:uncharacterized protein LOC141657285 isoform X2 n=1 Tax=Silene latifolia TaxID=37657 RepID=UPI003D778810
MDSDVPSPNEESNEQKAQFRKPTNETAHRKYRRHSPMDKLSDEDGSPKHDRRSRRNYNVIDSERRKEDRVDDRLSSRSEHGQRSDSYRHSSRGNRHDEQSKYGKHADEDDRSHRTGRDSRAVAHSDSRDRERDYNRSRDRYRDVDRHSRDQSDVAVKKYKEKEPSSDRTGYDGRRSSSRYDDRDRYVRDKDHRDDKREYKSSRDHRSDRTASFDDSVRQRSDYKSKWETDDVKDVGASKCEQDKNDPVDCHGDELNIPGTKGEHSLVSDDTTAKRPKLFSSEDTETRKDHAPANGSESVAGVDAAKVAAMKAAELVNKNLTSTGIMTADQKKKLLWGSKKSTPTEEPSNRWDSAMFSDRERQEKFNKLMGVKGEVKTASKPASSQDAEKLQVDLEKQYTAGLRRRDGRTVGLGL